jgi:hypothetical protein
MRLTKEQCALLKQHGFKWIKKLGKHASTDSCGADGLQDVVPSPDGFIVIYDETCAHTRSVATVAKIVWPDNPETHWIMVYWKDIVDERRPDWQMRPEVKALQHFLISREKASMN